MRYVVVCLLLAGCAGVGPGQNDKDGGGGGICPNNPAQCGGKCCGTSCIEVTLDPKNCGDCGRVCADKEVCGGGHCGCPTSSATVVQCGMGQSCCGIKGCKSLMSDTFNCGQCGTDCTTRGGDRCSGGLCKCGSNAACTGGQNCCSGACSASCAPPDMAMPIPDGGLPSTLCMCSDMCHDILRGHFSGLCYDTNCCFEDVATGACVPTLSCLPNQYP